MSDKKEMTPVLSSPLIRVILFLWVVIFPIVFVALPLFKITTGEGEFSMQPIWAFIAWVLSPLAGTIVMKYQNR